MSLGRRLRSARIPALIAIAAVLPLTLSLLLYLRPGWFPLGHTNHGRLIRPAVTITNAEPLPRDFFRGRWTLVYVGDPHCDAACRKTLYTTRQIRRGLAGSVPPVQRLYIVRGRTDARRYLRANQPELRVVEATDAAGRRLVDSFTRFSGTSAVYVVDPQGRLMMSYPIDEDPTGLLEDLRHLLGRDFQ